MLKKIGALVVVLASLYLVYSLLPTSVDTKAPTEDYCRYYSCPD